MSRVNGRTIVPTTQEEAAVLSQLGLKTLRCPRSANPYSVARRLRRAAGPNVDLEYLRGISVRTQFVPVPQQGPLQAAERDVDVPPLVTALEEVHVEVAAE